MSHSAQDQLRTALCLICASLVLAACSKPGRASESLIPPPRHCQVGLLLANQEISDSCPGGYCVDGRYLKGSLMRLGRINILGARNPAHLVGQQVLLQAQKKDGFHSRLTDQGPCSDKEPFPVQFRGDWLADEGGYRNSREQLDKAPYLEATTKAQALNMLQIKLPPGRVDHKKKSGTKPETLGQVSITISNPFDKALNNLKLIIHYEGGRGKPMPHYREHDLDLNPGQKLLIQVPSAVEPDSQAKKTGAWYRFHTATLAGKAGGCTFWPNTPKR